MKTENYINWQNYSASVGKVSQVTWSIDDMADFKWEEKYMTDEIPEDDNWNTFATNQKKELEKMYHDWQVPKDGSRHYMCIRPDLPINLKSILEPYTNIQFNYNFLKLTSGCSLMWHFDTYATFVKYNDIKLHQVKNISRTAIMMNDWDRGQILQVGNGIYTHWKAGDTFTWKADMWHGMSNFGPSECIISQITTLEEYV